MEKGERMHSVWIRIDGDNLNEDGIKEPVSFTTLGEYRNEDGVHALSYRENDEESGEEIETTIFADGESVIVTDNASYTPVFFQRGYRYLCAVEEDTAWGVFPTTVDIDMHEDVGSVDISYQMDLDGQVVGDNRIRVSYYAYEQDI